MIEVLLHPEDLKLKGRHGGYGIDIRELLVLQFESHHTQAIVDPNYPRRPNRDRHNYRPNMVSRGNYYGDVADYAELKRRMVEGWPEGVTRAADLAESIRDLVPVAKKRRRRPAWGDQGDEVNMQRVYAGQLDRAWRTTRREHVEGQKIISIDVDVCWNAGVRANDLFWSGATAIALTDVLEDQGYRVELFATAVNETNRRSVLSRVLVKRSDEPLNINNVAMMTAHPAMFRFYHLSSWCRAPWDIGGGYGSAMDMRAALDYAVDRGVLEGSDLQIGGALSRAAAEKEIREAVAKVQERVEAGV